MAAARAGSRSRATALYAALLASTCTTTRPRLGEITLQRPSDQNYELVEYTIEEGRIVSPDLDLSIEADGCLSGTFASAPLQLCPNGGIPQAQATRFTGTGGDFLVEVEAGKQVRADGQLWPGGIKLPGISMHVSVPLGLGPQWDELKRRPALLAIAAAVAGVRAGSSRPGKGLRTRRPRGP